MRLSADRHDIGHQAWRDILGVKAIHVLLDGVEQIYCITADEEEGFIVRCVTDEEGYLVVEDDTTKTERVEGDVVINLMDIA